MRFKTKDSALAFYVSELENLDKVLYEPLVDITWSRDITLRSGVSFDDETVSYIRTNFASSGTQSAVGKPWISAKTTQLPGVDVNGTKYITNVRPLGREVSYTSIELDRAARTGRPIDRMKIDAFNNLYQMDTDGMVYIGDTDVGETGLLNSSAVTAGSVSGSGSAKLWVNKTADQILADVNSLLNAVWVASNFKYCPQNLLLPPAQYALIVSTKVSDAGNVSILTFLEQNSLSLKVNGKVLDIKPSKWLTGRGASGADRMLAYTNRNNLVRFPLVPVRRETAYYQSINFIAPYIYGYGAIEWVYPETAEYMDGL